MRLIRYEIFAEAIRDAPTIEKMRQNNGDDKQ